MYVGCGANCGCGLRGLGDGSTDQTVSAAASAIGSITGIPGLGQVAGFIASMFGPSPHFTPSGVPYDTQAKTIKTLIQQVATLANELHAREGLPPIPVPNFSFTSSDDPLVAKWMGALLNNQTVAAGTSIDAVIADQSQGIMDQAVSAAQSLIQQLDQELAQPASTPLASVTAATNPAALVPAADYQSQQGVPSAPVQGSYDHVQAGAPPAPIMAGANVPMLAAGVAGLFAFLLIARSI